MSTPAEQHPDIRRALQEAFDGRPPTPNRVPVRFTPKQEEDRRFHIEGDDDHQQPYSD